MTLSTKATTTANRYFGDRAQQYDARRRGQPKWLAEDKAIRAGLADLVAGDTVLDVPCGTGRFFPYYQERGFAVTAIDVSKDMLTEARKHLRGSHKIFCDTGSIFALPLDDQAVEATVCCRFANLIEAADLTVALAELQRVTRGRILMTLRRRHRQASGRYHHAHDVAVVEAAIQPGWWLATVEPLHEVDYCLLRLERHA